MWGPQSGSGTNTFQIVRGQLDLDKTLVDKSGLSFAGCRDQSKSNRRPARRAQFVCCTRLLLRCVRCRPSFVRSSGFGKRPLSPRSKVGQYQDDFLHASVLHPMKKCVYICIYLYMYMYTYSSNRVMLPGNSAQVYTSIGSLVFASHLYVYLYFNLTLWLLISSSEFF